MLIHTVIFWLKKELSLQERVNFKEQLQNLDLISSVHQLHVGAPAPTTQRPVIDDSYDFCLTVILENVEAHDHYQEDPIHLAFIQNCSLLWERVKIFDAE